MKVDSKHILHPGLRFGKKFNEGEAVLHCEKFRKCATNRTKKYKNEIAGSKS